MRNWPVLVVFAVVFLLTACPQQQKQDTGVNGATSSTTPATPPANGAQPGGETPGATTPPDAPAGAETPAGPSALHGEWLALFGRQDEGMLADTWQEDQRIKFDQQGQMVFTISLKGQQAKVQGSYTAGNSGELQLVLSAAKVMESGLSHLVPLGIGRNEEVGLLKQAGRNEEVGLVESGRPDAAGNITRNIKYEVLGNYMFLSDKFDHIMLYTRFVADPSAASGLDGSWKANFGTVENIAAVATGKGSELSIDMGAQGMFIGSMISGVAVGKIKRANEIFLATLRPEGSDRLSGLYLAAPYVQLSTDLTLTKDK